MSDPSDLVTITVSRDDVMLVVNAPCSMWHADVLAAASRLRRALPEPEWEPSDEMVDATWPALLDEGVLIIPSTPRRDARDLAARCLKAMHDAGIHMELREDAG